MIQALTWISTHADQIIGAITSIVTGASALAALTPTPKDDSIIGKLYKVIDFLALNIGKAKDKGDQK
jgi:hypothetical protein